MDIRVRRATNSDIEAMTGLLANLFSIETDFTPDADKQVKGLTMMLAQPEERAVIVAEARGQKSGEVVGMVTGQMLISTAQGGLVTLIEDLFISPQHRGTGVGSRLLREVEAWARSLGSTRLHLLADKDNGPAKAFYENAGWSLSNLICLRKTNLNETKTKSSGATLCPGMNELNHQRSNNHA